MNRATELFEELRTLDVLLVQQSMISLFSRQGGSRAREALQMLETKKLAEHFNEKCLTKSHN